MQICGVSGWNLHRRSWMSSGHNDFFVVGVFYREASLNRGTKCVS